MVEQTGHQASTAGINPLDNEVVLENVHPSWINWTRYLLGALLFVAIGAMIGDSIGAFLVVVGVLFFLGVYWSRKRSRIIVTNQRIKSNIGLLRSSTQETRIDNVQGVSTSSGILEGLIGKGTVTVTDAASERFGLAGVGSYEELARTIRQQQQAAAQPAQNRAHRPAGGAAGSRGTSGSGQHVGGGSTQNRRGRADERTDRGRSEAEDNRGTGSDQRPDSDRSDEELEPCPDCDERIDPTASFCPNCGTEDPFHDPEPADDRSSSEQVNADAGSQPARPVAESVLERTNFESDVAEELCRTLAAERLDESRFQSVLEDAVDGLESASTVRRAVAAIDEQPSERDLESARRGLGRLNSPLARNVRPAVEYALETKTALGDRERDHDRLQDVAETICDEAARAGALSFRASDVTGRAVEFADALENGEVIVERPGVSMETVVEDVRRSSGLRTPQSRELLDALADPSERDAEGVLRSAVERIDDAADREDALADIGTADVRRRLDSLDEELHRQEGEIYRHLADRIREFEAVLDQPDEVDDVRLFAIYHECTFYDRTLLPRLSRTGTTGQPTDVGRLLADVDNRIDGIESDYIAVRADHNHSIPKHFVSLAHDLHGRARTLESDRPERATGVLVATDELLDHVERLYERNEYSVMLRRLRG